MKLKEIFFRDGNFSSLLQGIFMLLGGGIVFAGLKFFDSIILTSIGLAFLALGGYSSRAKTLGIKPFDNSYKRAKKSYMSDKDQSSNEE